MATAKNISTENKINIVTNTENNVTVTQPTIQTVEITTGPQGKKGDIGPIGPTGPSSSVAGNDQEIQYNSNDNLAASSKFKFIYDSSSLEQGNGVNASGSYSHAEGWFTTAIGQASHAEGRSNIVIGDYSHAEGYNNNVTGLYSHVAGENNILTGRGTYVNGRYNSGSSNWSTVVGRSNILTIDSDYSFVGGYLSKVSSSFYGFAFGESAFVYGNHGFAIGQETSASFYGFALGSKTKASFAARAAGRETTANSRYTHTEGVNTQGGGEFQHLFTSSLTEPTTNWGDPGSDINNGDVWYNTSNSLLYAYTGSGTVSQGFVSQNDEAITVPFFITSSGTLTTATFGSGDVFPAASSSAVLAARYNYDQAYYSHAEGSNNKTYGRASHAEGYFNQAGGYASHVEGYFTRTGKINEYGAVAQGGSGSYAHAEGWQTQANGIASHAEGFSAKSRGNYSHAQGKVTIAEGDYQHTMGHYNETNTTSLVIIGNGTSSNNRKNLVEFNLGGVLINQPITASSNISSSGTVFGITGSFSHLVGNSPITVGDPVTFEQPITASAGIQIEGTSRTLFTTASIVYSGSNVTQITQSFGATQQITNIIYSGSFEDGNPLSISVTGSDGINKLYTLTYSASLVTQIIQS